MKVPYVFTFTLNNVEMKPSKRKSSSSLLRPIAKSLLYDQDMVMPEDEHEKHYYEMGSNFADVDETDMLTYNYEALMYCLCFRFFCLVGIDVDPTKLSKYDLDIAIKQGRIYIT